MKSLFNRHIYLRQIFRERKWIDYINMLSTEWQSRNGREAETEAVTGATVSAERRTDTQRETNGRYVPNTRLRAYGRKLPLYIPKVCVENRIIYFILKIPQYYN